MQSERNAVFYSQEGAVNEYPKTDVYPREGGEVQLEQLRARLPKYCPPCVSCRLCLLHLSCPCSVLYAVWYISVVKGCVSLDVVFHHRSLETIWRCLWSSPWLVPPISPSCQASLIREARTRRTPLVHVYNTYKSSTHTLYARCTQV